MLTNIWSWHASCIHYHYCYSSCTAIYAIHNIFTTLHRQARYWHSLTTRAAHAVSTNRWHGQFTFTLYAPLIANPVTDYNPCNTLTQISECVWKLMKQIHEKLNQRKQVAMPCADTGILVLTVTECTKYWHEEIVTAMIRRRVFLNIGKFRELNVQQ